MNNKKETPKDNFNATPCKNDVMRSAFVLKKCTCCNLEFPKTEDYFFRKTEKQKLASGKIATYHSFRAFCKKCHGKKNEERRIKGRCKVLNCDVSDYRENWKKQYSETRANDFEALSCLSSGQYNNYLKLKKKGLVNNYQDYLNSRSLRISEAAKKRGEQSKWHGKLKERRKEERQRQKERLTDSYVANVVMKKTVKEVPKEMIEFKRLTIQLKRELENLKTI